MSSSGAAPRMDGNSPSIAVPCRLATGVAGFQNGVTDFVIDTKPPLTNASWDHVSASLVVVSY